MRAWRDRDGSCGSGRRECDGCGGNLLTRMSGILNAALHRILDLFSSAASDCRLSEKLFLSIYHLCWWIALPLVLLRLWICGRKNPGYLRNIRQRLGLYGSSGDQGGVAGAEFLGAGSWCLHAVSVGENVAASSLVNLWLQHYPQQKVVVTCMTPTGAEQITKLYGKQVTQVYLPYDIPCLVKRFFDHFNPRLLVIMETELWPALIYEADRRNIPIFLVNGRLSDRSFEHYYRIRRLVRAWLNRFTLVMVQSQQDLMKFAKLGMASNRLTLTGNLKFDLSVTSVQRQQAEGLRKVWGQRPVLIAASTHAGEHELIKQAAQLIWQQCPELLLVIAPRHPENFEAVFQLFKEDGVGGGSDSDGDGKNGSNGDNATRDYAIKSDVMCDNEATVVRYSELTKYDNERTRVVVADVMGRMMSLYGASDLVLVGGSLLPIGGHNLLEPAAWQKPLLSGPHLSNFIDIRDKLLQQDGLIIVRDSGELAERVLQLLKDREAASRLGVNGYQVVCANRGTTGRVMEQISRYAGGASKTDQAA